MSTRSLIVANINVCKYHRLGGGYAKCLEHALFCKLEWEWDLLNLERQQSREPPPPFFFFVLLRRGLFSRLYLVCHIFHVGCCHVYVMSVSTCIRVENLRRSVSQFPLLQKRLCQKKQKFFSFKKNKKAGTSLDNHYVQINKKKPLSKRTNLCFHIDSCVLTLLWARHADSHFFFISPCLLRVSKLTLTKPWHNQVHLT